MIKLKKFEILKTSKHSFLCYVPRWGDENDWFYVLAVNSHPEHSVFHGYEIYGFGKTAEEALLKGVGSLTEAALNGISFESMKDLSFPELIDIFQKKEGDISESIHQLFISDKDKEYGPDQPMSICIEDGKAYPLVC
jgi:hypothetical protein